MMNGVVDEKMNDQHLFSRIRINFVYDNVNSTVGLMV